MKEAAIQTFLQLHRKIKKCEPKSDSLLSGRLGLCLYYNALFHAFGNLEDSEMAVSHLEKVFANLKDEGHKLRGTSFSNGGAGLGYIVNLFSQEESIKIDISPDLLELDDYLYKTSVEQIIQNDKVDFLHGALGIIHYFTQRTLNKNIEAYLTRLIVSFIHKAVEEERGIWFRNWVVEKTEVEEINFSLSHGLVGMLLILINAYNAGLTLESIPETISKGVEFILSYQQEIVTKKNWSFFPSSINKTNRLDFFLSQRLAWCYGDLGVVLLLYKSAELLSKPEWFEKANIMGTFTLMRKDFESTIATETLFCHGTSGLAQFYKTLYHLSGIKEYLNGQSYWIEKTLKLLPSELEEGLYHEKEAELLEGLLGINLALLSFISEKNITWSKALLL